MNCYLALRQSELDAIANEGLKGLLHGKRAYTDLLAIVGITQTTLNNFETANPQTYPCYPSIDAAGCQ